ncbi:hypothetical protein SAMN04490220_0926 [Rhodococcus jostii]|uniref:Uncharacterized protein n=1 Tax=Rhodococcus jostii TaxID=132919 RepID=A0A1H4JKH8_RHOJO|nr:hypothetical protein SAMN04490220_0926 [Rhodococcus jostii]
MRSLKAARAPVLRGVLRLILGTRQAVLVGRTKR